MNWTPPMLAQKQEPEAVIQEIEDDPLAQFVWTRVPELSHGIRQWTRKFRRQTEPREPLVRRTAECAEC